MSDQLTNLERFSLTKTDSQAIDTIANGPCKPLSRAVGAGVVVLTNSADFIAHTVLAILKTVGTVTFTPYHFAAVFIPTWKHFDDLTFSSVLVHVMNMKNALGNTIFLPILVLTSPKRAHALMKGAEIRIIQKQAQKRLPAATPSEPAKPAFKAAVVDVAEKTPQTTAQPVINLAHQETAPSSEPYSVLEDYYYGDGISRAVNTGKTKAAATLTAAKQASVDALNTGKEKSLNAWTAAKQSGASVLKKSVETVKHAPAYLGSLGSELLNRSSYFEGLNLLSRNDHQNEAEEAQGIANFFDNVINETENTPTLDNCTETDEGLSTFFETVMVSEKPSLYERVKSSFFAFVPKMPSFSLFPSKTMPERIVVKHVPAPSRASMEDQAEVQSEDQEAEGIAKFFEGLEAEQAEVQAEAEEAEGIANFFASVKAEQDVVHAEDQEAEGIAKFFASVEAEQDVVHAEDQEAEGIAKFFEGLEAEQAEVQTEAVEAEDQEAEGYNSDSAIFYQNRTDSARSNRRGSF